MNPNKHECKLRKQIIEDEECFDFVMAINHLNSKITEEKILKEYPNAIDICMKCKFNLYNDEDLQE